MFGLYNRSLPGLKAGQPIPARTVNEIRDAVERSRPVTSSGDAIGVQQLPNGFAVRDTSVVHRLGKITTAVTAMSGSTPGTGKAKFQIFRGTGALVDTGVEIPVWNTTEKIWAVTAYVQMRQIDGYWFVDVIDKCANLS